MSSPLSVPEPWNAVADGYSQFAVPMFTEFAAHALELLALPEGQRVLDVACGAGAVTALLAKQGHAVDAVDFSENMLACCRERLATQGLSANVQLMDGQALKFDNESFDAALSMFGWMFFPDRTRGLSEFLRVLKPGGQLAVSSWAPVADSPLMALVFGALQKMVPPEPSAAKAVASLDDSNVLAAELFAAGFDEVQIIRSTRGFEVTSLDEFWHGMAESSAPLVMLRKKLGEAVWQEKVPAAMSYLKEQCPVLPVNKSSDAWIAIARKPES